MLSMIVAFDPNQVIGKGNVMPWHYPEDLKYFKEVTQFKTVVMGSNTFESILSTLKKPLPNRHHVILTRNKDKYQNLETYQNINDFLKNYQNKKEEVFVIGGAQIFNQLLPYVDRLYITHIKQEYEGDVYFPLYKKNDFELITEKLNGELRFCVYERKVKSNESHLFNA